MAVIIIVASNRSFVFEPTLIWRSKGPRCFKSLCTFVPVKILGWTQTLWRVFCRDLTVKCAKKSSRLSYFGFWDNATCHPETLQARLTNIKIVFLPKNTTSGLQFLNASIIRSFKHKYRKLLVCHVVSRIDEHVYWNGHLASNRLEKCIHGGQKQWFKKCGFDVGDMSIVNEEIGTEFQELFEQIYSETTLDEYIYFDGEDNYVRASC